jgi:hypothetical protein
MKKSGKNYRKMLLRFLAGLLVVVATGPVLVACNGNIKLVDDWRTADRSSTGIAPDPGKVKEAVVQVYAARAFEWRGIFAVHTWIATKEAGAVHYRVHQVVGFRLRRGLPALMSEPEIPDRSWFGQTGRILVDLRGPGAEAAIPAILEAVRDYPYKNDYVLWPGPNSNTFTAWVARRVPALRLDLPPTAIGKDYLGATDFLAPAPSGTGWQISLFGLLGVTLAGEEGLAFNLLTADFGLNPFKPALRLPGVGIVGGPEGATAEQGATAVD